MILWIIAIVVGVALGVGFAFLITGIVLNASNKIGDSKGSFENFAVFPLRILNQQDNVGKRGGFFS